MRLHLSTDRVHRSFLIALSDSPDYRAECDRSRENVIYRASGRWRRDRGSRTPEWDRDRLASELKFLVGAEFELDLTGFDVPEVDFRLEEDRIAREDEPGPEDDVPPVVASLPPITQVGDLWILGRHRLLCGDARDEVAYKALLGGESAAMAFSDPPYNVRAVSIGSRGAIKHADFAMAAGEMSREEYMAFLSGCFQRMAAHSVDGAVHFLCTDGHHLAKMTAAIEAAYGAHLPVQRWVKPWGPR